jgi:hypothetical protein
MNKVSGCKKAELVVKVAMAALCCSGVVYATCPNTEASAKSQPTAASCFNCETWTEENTGSACTYADTQDALIYGACWDENAYGRKAIAVAPPVLVNGMLHWFKGTCSFGICQGGTITGTTSYTANQMTDVPCPPE